MNILVILNFAASLQGIFITYLIAQKRLKDIRYLLLGALTLILSISLLGGVLGLSGYYRVIPHLINIADPLFLLYGPLLYLYIYALINNKLPKYYLLHGIPYLAYVISFMPFYVQGPEEKIKFAEYIFLNNDVPRKALFMQLARIVHITIYITICLVLVKSFQKRIKDNFSDIEKITLHQVNNVLYFFLFTLITAITTFLLSLLLSYNYNLSNNIIGLSVSLIIYAIAVTTWNRKSVEEGKFASLTQRRNGNNQLAPDRKESNTTRSVFVLTDEQYDDFVERLEMAIESEKVFVENDISLTQLSKKLGIQPYQLSELISRVAGESFFEYINRHRIEEIKTRLKDPKYNALSILGVAMDCGFNSKSSFNTAFKKYTGLTPSEYRKQLIQ